MTAMTHGHDTDPIPGDDDHHDASVPPSPPSTGTAAPPGDRLKGTVADADLLSAFGRWVAQERIIESLVSSADDDAYVAACDRADGIAREIAAMPSRSVTGLAAKTYLLAHTRYGGRRGCILAVALPGNDGDDPVCAALERSVLADAVNCLPLPDSARIPG